MIYLYRILFLPLLLLASPYYLWRMWKRGGYGRDWKHRFGHYGESLPAKANRKRVWLHAVSVGEALAVKPLIELFLQEENTEVILSTTTSTAYKLISAWNTLPRFYTCIFPIDFWLFSRRAWNNISPDLMLLAEGELWGEHLYQAKKRNTPVCLVNARLSDRSFRRYQKLPLVRNFMLAPLTAIYCQSPQDEERFSSLFSQNIAIVTLGNIKLDTSPPTLRENDKELWFQELGFHDTGKPRLVVLGSSTWEGEEKLLLQNFHELRERFQEKMDLRLLIVPRHAERRKEIIQLLQSQSLSFHVRSQTKQAARDTLIYLADTTGELALLTQLADIVVVGKSFPPHTEGQSPVEAAYAGKAIICGHGMSNFRIIVRSMKEANALTQIAPQELSGTLKMLLADDDLRKDFSRRAHVWINTHKGATARHFKKLASYL